jgi:hypothetical protein
MQGFKWCEEFFAVTRLMLNAILYANTISSLRRKKLWLYRKVTSPPKLVLRQVDDVPVVSPEGTSWGGKRNVKNFKKIVNKLISNWLKTVPKNEKAFGNRPGEW